MLPELGHQPLRAGLLLERWGEGPPLAVGTPCGHPGSHAWPGRGAKKWTWTLSCQRSPGRLSSSHPQTWVFLRPHKGPGSLSPVTVSVPHAKHHPLLWTNPRGDPETTQAFQREPQVQASSSRIVRGPGIRALGLSCLEAGATSCL